MKWQKLGRIFDPSEHKLFNECIGYAQSPQAVVFNDYLRIYFSTRKIDRSGKYVSHISFIDIEKNFKNIKHISNHTVIELGDLGCFDEHGIFPINVVRNGESLYAYTCGWNRKASVSVDTGIGLAISDDNGYTFKKIGRGPILTATLHEPFLVGDPFVKIQADAWHMWYIFGTKWQLFSNELSPDRVYKIGHATSRDGITWHKEGRQLISDIFTDECQALPTVMCWHDRWHMFFCYRQSSDFRRNKARSYRIGYAYSADLVHWIRDDSKAGIDVSPAGWDSEMQAYPHVFQCDGRWYMLYNGNEFGRHGFGLARLEEGNEQ